MKARKSQNKRPSLVHNVSNVSKQTRPSQTELDANVPRCQSLDAHMAGLPGALVY